MDPREDSWYIFDEHYDDIIEDHVLEEFFHPVVQDNHQLRRCFSKKSEVLKIIESLSNRNEPQ